MKLEWDRAVNVKTNSLRRQQSMILEKTYAQTALAWSMLTNKDVEVQFSPI